jgi:L-arabinose isomerase
MDQVKAGLALLTAEWFSQINLNSTDDPEANITQIVQENARQAIATLGRHFALVHPEVITTIEDAKQACEDYRREHVDVIILCNLIYSGDDTIIEIALNGQGTPFLIWSFHPEKKLQRITSMARYFRVTGASGMLQGCAPLKRMGIRFGFVLGTPGDARLDRELADWARALAVVKRLKSVKIAAIGRRYEPMSGAWFDELRLKTRLGPKVVWISAYECAQEARAIPQAQIDAFISGQKQRYQICGVPEDALQAAARASIATYNLARKYQCEVVSVQDMDEELHQLLGCRPQMTYQKMFDEGIVAGMEADIDSALCVWIVQNLIGSPAMYGEIFTYSEADNYLVVGHASMHDLSLAGDHEITLVPDGEFKHVDRYVGVWDEFICKPGPVTLVALFEDNDVYRLQVCAGESLESPKWIPGNVHALVRLDLPLPRFMEDIATAGVTQHFTMCYGDVKPRLKIMARQLGLEYIDLDEGYQRRQEP